MQVGKGRAGGNTVQVTGNGAHVLGDGPFVVVQHHDEAFGLRLGVIQGLVTDAAGEGGIAGHGHDMLPASAQIASHSHAEGGGKSRARMPGAVAIVLAFGAQEKAVQPLVLPHGGDAIEPAGKHFVDITLVTDIEDKAIARRFENAMQGNGQFDDSEVGAEMPAGLRQNADQFLAHLLGKLRQILLAQSLDVRRAANAFEQRWFGSGLRRG